MVLRCRTIKTTLKSVLRETDPGTFTDISPEESELGPISRAVLTTHRVVTRGLLLLKLYLISPEYENEPRLVNRLVVLSAFRAVTTKKPRGGSKVKDRALQRALDELWARYFPSIAPLPRDCLAEVLLYAADEVVKAFETNIRENYVGYVKKYAKAELKEGLEAAGYNGRQSREILGKVSFDLLNRDPPASSPEQYRQWIEEAREVVLPVKRAYEKSPVAYDIKAHPQDYFLPMLRIVKRLEERGAKLPNVCPVRTSLVPRHITIDTRALLQIYAGYKDKDGKKLTKDNVWDFIFETSLKAFRRPSGGYKFHRMIQTDGVSCSVIHSKKEVRLETGEEEEGSTANEEETEEAEKYIDKLSDDEKERLGGRKVVGIDPNMKDLLFCVEEEKRRFRYTQNQRRKEMKTKKYQRITTRKEKEVNGELRLEGKRTVVECVQELSRENHKSVNIERFAAYVRVKLDTGPETERLYHSPILRKMRLNRFWNTKRSERKMLERFRETFGSPKEVVVGFGDWEQQHHRRYSEPVKGKGFRNLLRKKGGYEVYLVHEHKTSVQCSRCQRSGARCANLHLYRDPDRRKKRADRRLVEVHRLLTCTTCGRRWNRDVNSAINIRRIAIDALRGLARPDYLARCHESDSDIVDEVPG